MQPLVLTTSKFTHLSFKKLVEIKASFRCICTLFLSLVILINSVVISDIISLYENPARYKLLNHKTLN